MDKNALEVRVIFLGVKMENSTERYEEIIGPTSSECIAHASAHHCKSFSHFLHCIVHMRMCLHICLCTQEIQLIEMVYIDESTCGQICKLHNVCDAKSIVWFVHIYVYSGAFIYTTYIIALLYAYLHLKMKSSWPLTPRYSRFFRTSMEVCGRSSPRDATTTLSVMWPAKLTDEMEVEVMWQHQGGKQTKAPE